MFCLYYFVDLFAFVVTIDYCVLYLIKKDYVSPFSFAHRGFCIIWYYCIIFHRDNKYFIKCFIEIFYCMVFEMKNDPRKWIHGNLMLYFVSQKIWWSHLYILSSVPWMNYLINRRLAKVTSHWVCKIRKKLEFPTLLLVKSCLPPVDILKQISNK